MTTTRTVARYGWKPDLPDRRDLLYRAARNPSFDGLPPSADLRAFCSPVVDQGHLGSCTGNCLTAGVEFLENRFGLPPEPLARLFVYYNERAIEGTITQDAGAMIRDGIKSLVTWGVCPEAMWAYSDNTLSFQLRPTDNCYAVAGDHRILVYARVNGVDEMRHCLADGYPFAIGFSVYEAFESDAVAQSGVVPMPAPTERLLGGHAVLVVGYDDAARRFVVRNSWGPDWGQGGYFTIPYDYLGDPSLADDAWTMRREASF